MFKHKPIVTAIAVAMSNLAHADLTSGLVAHYPFNGNANDASGNGNNGIVYGATLTADRFGNENSAFNFDGINSYIQIKNSSLINFQTNQDFTISTWIKANSYQPDTINTDNDIIEKWYNGEQRYPYVIRYVNNIGTIMAANYDGASISTLSIGRIDDGEFHYIVYERQNGYFYFYVDGSLNDSNIDSNLNDTSNSSDLFIGCRGNYNNGCLVGQKNMFKGSVDDIRIYNRALSQSEITELYTLQNPNTPLAPTCTSKPATNITINSATLNGNVVSNGTTATANFEFGPTVTYGTTVAAAPAKVYSSTPVAISANKTGLACNTTYHYRCQAANSVGTGYGTDQSFTTLATCTPNTWLYPATPAVLVGKPFSLDIHVNSNNNTVGAYDYTVNFDTTKLLVDTTYQNDAATCEQGICPGTSAVSTSSVNVDTSSGNIRLTGFDPTGTGPGNDLQLLQIYFIAKNISGTTVVGLTTNELTNSVGEPLGSVATGATVTISAGLCGDSDGNGTVNIVDALAIARYLVGLPPPPTINPTLADVNRSGTVSIVDALHISRYAVGLVVTGTCSIGQPL